MKFDLKEFLRPEKIKIVIFLGLFVASSIIPEIPSFFCADCGDALGFPLFFYKPWIPLCIATTHGECGPFFYAENLIIDSVFWYLVSTFLIHMKRRYK